MLDEAARATAPNRRHANPRPRLRCARPAQTSSACAKRSTSSTVWRAWWRS